MKFEVDFNDKETKILEEIAVKKGYSVSALLKQAVRVYQNLEMKIEKGQISPQVFSELLRDQDQIPKYQLPNSNQD